MKLWLLVALLCVSSVVAWSVPGSLFVNESNASVSYPGGVFQYNASGVASYEVLFNTSINATNASVSLLGGQQQNVSGFFDVLQVSCQRNDSALCVVTQALSSGQSLSRSDASCSVSVSCAAQGNVSCPNLTSERPVKITREVEIYKNQNVFTFKLDGEVQTIDASFQNASQYRNLTFTCPISIENVTNDTSVAAQDVFNLCSDYMPYFMDWFNMSLNKCFDNWDAYRDFVKSRDVVIAQANQELSDCRAAGGQKDGSLNVCNAQVDTMTQQAADKESTMRGLQLMLVFLALVVAVLIVVVAVLLHRDGSGGY